MYRWSPGIERNVDQRASSLLPAGAYDFLGFAQVRRAVALAISSFECASARRIGCLALARVGTTKDSRRMAGSSAMGCASRDGPISRMDN